MDSQASELGGLYGKQFSAPTVMSGMADDDENRREVSPTGSSPASRDASTAQRKTGRGARKG